MDEVYFLARFTPFWAVPCLMIGFEFGYMFWLRKKKKASLISFSVFGISLASLVFYYVAGGPEKAVEVLKTVVYFYTY